MEFCDSLKDIDFFGKLPELYIKGKPKQPTIIGRAFTVIFIILYIIIFAYKLYRMFIRLDITFYDSYSTTEETPSINITNENFYLLFSVYNDSGLPFIDETVYYPMAYFVEGDLEKIELERCNIDKIGSKYKQLLSEVDLDNYYCLSNVNYTLLGYINSIKILLFPCKNNTENNDHCKPKEIIDEYLNGKTLEVQFEDILITPLNFDSPVKERINLIYTSIFKTFGQYMYTEMQLVNIETSTNIIGFDFLSNPKTDYFIKYYSLEIIPQPGYDLNDETNNYPIVEIEFQLNEKILLEKRQYIQLIDVLGEVGGLMEIIFSFFGLLCSFVTDILYKKSIANNLFSFDLRKKMISLKKGKDLIFRINSNKNKEEKNVGSILTSQNTNINKINKERLLIMDTLNDKEISDKMSENYLINKKNILEINPYGNKANKENYDNHSVKNHAKELNKSKSRPFLNISKKNNKSILVPDNKNDMIINKFNLKDTLIILCFCYKNKKNNINKILLDETMNIIIEKLDIFNLFRNICAIENLKNDFDYNIGIFKLSENCSNNLQDIG